jgi:hypothetical protein
LAGTVADTAPLGVGSPATPSSECRMAVPSGNGKNTVPVCGASAELIASGAYVRTYSAIFQGLTLVHVRLNSSAFCGTRWVTAGFQ